LPAPYEEANCSVEGAVPEEYAGDTIGDLAMILDAASG